MSHRNDVLLILKQHAGMTYPTLLSKIQSQYSSLNSARAALSRDLKDLESFGLIKRQGNNIFVTDKGNAQLISKMRSKLLSKLNTSIHSKKNYLEISSIIENLQTLIERSKADPDLLRAAKASVDFSLADLESIDTKLEEQSKQIAVFQKAFKKQILALESLGFSTRISFPFSLDAINALSIFVSSHVEQKEFFLECAHQELLDFLKKEFPNITLKEKNLHVPSLIFKKFLLAVHTYSLTEMQLFSCKLFFKDFTVKATATRLYVLASPDVVALLREK